MEVSMWWAFMAAALVAGVVGGGWLALRVALRKQDATLRRRAAELHQKYASTIEQLRADQVRSQAELEQARTSFKRQLAVVAEEPMAAVARAEERLRAVYDELDRTRRNHAARDSMSADLDGFAATRPMHEGL
jgi:multidrug efflux pump subunit AcrA (membrane-fusion protein)